MHRGDAASVSGGSAAAAPAGPRLLGSVVHRAGAASARRRLLVAEDVVDVVLPPAPARGPDRLSGSHRGVVDRTLGAGVALVVVLALLDVVTLDEPEVLERASPCVPDRHLGSDSA